MWKRGKKSTQKAVGPPLQEARTAARWWADQLRELALSLEPLTEQDFKGVSRTKLDLIGAPIDYRMSREVLEALTEPNIKTFEESLAAAIQAEFEKVSFCFWSQRDKYHIDDLLGPHLEAAGIPTEMGVFQPIFHHSMATVIESGKVVAHGGIVPSKVVSGKSLPLLA